MGTWSSGEGHGRCHVLRDRQGSRLGRCERGFTVDTIRVTLPHGEGEDRKRKDKFKVVGVGGMGAMAQNSMKVKSHENVAAERGRAFREPHRCQGKDPARWPRHVTGLARSVLENPVSASPSQHLHVSPILTPQA